MASAVTGRTVRERRHDPDQRFTVGLRVSHLLEAVEFEPPGFPPAATLIVRRLRDPMPRRLQPDPWTVRPVAVWEQAARASVADIWRRAARPAREAVPSNADAVLFADKGELLSCLALDLLSGEASSFWWWRAILKSLRQSGLSAVIAGWRRDARYVPAALNHLTSRGKAVWVLKPFSPAQAWTVLQDVAREFEISIPWSEPVEGRNLAGLEDAEFTADPNGLAHSGPSAAGSRISDQRPVAPWSRLLPEAEFVADLAREQAALLGVSLVLQRFPQIARSAWFGEAFRIWYQFSPLNSEALAKADLVVCTPGLPLDSSFGPLANLQATRVSETAKSPESFALRPRSSEDEGVVPNGEVETKKGNAQSASLSLARRKSDFASEATQAQPSNVEGFMPSPATTEIYRHGQTGILTASQTFPLDDSRTRQYEVEHQNEAIEPGRSVEVLPTQTMMVKMESAVRSVFESGNGVETELGGLLFLVNVLKTLRLPQSVEAESGSELGLGSWELLELLGRCLLGHASAHLAADPIWTALEMLDGREPGVAPGPNFLPANYYRLPQSWLLESIGSAQINRLAVRLRESRLQLWHPLGFQLADLRFDSPPSRSAIEREKSRISGNPIFPRCPLGRYASKLLAGCRPLGIIIDGPLRRFLAFLMPYVRWRLALALGVSSMYDSAIVKSLLLRPGRIWLTSSHVDLVMDLNHATGQVRLSGLDADPGWVPELGRVVKFHYRRMSL